VKLLERRPGFLPTYWDALQGKLFLEVKPGEMFLHQTTLTHGVGSNVIGLDRGQLGSTRLVSFERRGPKVLLVEHNTRFQALKGSEAEQKSVTDSFAHSVLWGFKVEAEEGGRVLIDATPFLQSDAHGVVDRLRETGQGDYALDDARSAVDPAFCKAFPKNTEAEADLTFVTRAQASDQVSRVSPSGAVVSVRVRHSFIALPEAGYEPRAFDPRVGAIPLEIYDYASPFTGPLEQRWILRHRLQKKDPNAAISEPIRPLVYYLDPAAPEPIRSALLEGASWWKAGFEALGFRNAFEVKLLPPDADPMDIRYNMILWTHRSTRGWSLGTVVADPRTGEIIKGTVILESLRIRQDFLIAAGLKTPFEAPSDPSVWAGSEAGQLALARLRQLAAHEVGHTLGLMHNFAASSQDRASVMDYPSPRILIKDGHLDFSKAYARGLGAFDHFALEYAYRTFAPGTDEATGLKRVLAEGLAKDLRYVKDEHAREVGTAHPHGSVWDDGAEPLASLRHELEVRRIGLETFGPQSQPDGEPRSMLEARLLPLYLHHRYQVEATAKLIGGLDFSYALREGKGSAPTQVRTLVNGDLQRKALGALLTCLDPAFLALPQRILDLIPPTADGFEGGIAENFPTHNGAGFDPLAAADAAAEVVLGALLHPDRAARLVQHHAESTDRPGLKEVLGAIVTQCFQPAPSVPLQALVARDVQRGLVDHLEALAGSAASFEVRSEAEAQLAALVERLGGKNQGQEAAYRSALRHRIQRFLARPYARPKAPEPTVVPAGAPIGD
jgi:hypothetical protein